jgi:hypothetical protein
MSPRQLFSPDNFAFKLWLPKIFIKHWVLRKMPARRILKKPTENWPCNTTPIRTRATKLLRKKFKAVNEANSVLIDPEKRKLYDQYGENWEQVQQGGPAGGGASGRPRTARQQPPFSFDASDFENDERFEDLFSQFFGGQQAGRGRAPQSAQWR